MAIPEAAKRLARKSPTLERHAVNLVHPSNRGQRLRALGRAARYDVKTRLLRRPTVATLGEKSKVICYPGETNSPHAAYRNPPNWEMVAWRHLRPGDLFLDVGANIGIYTLFALERGAEVIAFEPDAGNAARIREHLTLNGYTAEVIEKAASSEAGTLRFTTGLDSYNHIAVADEAAVEIEATTIDDVLGDRKAAGMKVDVEGAERLVLLGASRALAEHRIALLQVEWSAKQAEEQGEDRGDVADLLRGHGYELLMLDRQAGGLHVIPGAVPQVQDIFARPAPTAGI